MPKLITFFGGSSIKFTYDATGRKLRKDFYTSTNQTTTWYAGELEYSYSGTVNSGVPTTTAIDFIHTAAGRLKPVSTSSPMQYSYEYYLTDHLGNNRILFTADGNGDAIVLQENHYDPLGMTLTGLNYANCFSAKYKNKRTNHQVSFLL